MKPVRKQTVSGSRYETLYYDSSKNEIIRNEVAQPDNPKDPKVGDKYSLVYKCVDVSSAGEPIWAWDFEQII